MFVMYLIVVGIIVTILYAIYEAQRLVRLKKERTAIYGNEKRSSRFSKVLNRVFQKGYVFLLRVPVLRILIKRVRRKIETLALYDEYQLRRKVMEIIAYILAIITIFIVFLLLLKPAWLFVFWAFVGVLVLSGILIDFLVYRIEYKLLRQLKEFINRVSFYYQQTKMVTDAVFESIPFAGPEMKEHAKRIYKILNSLDIESELGQYEEVAPSRHLRAFASLLVLVFERGDKIDKKSAFLNGLMSINKELNDEILNRSRLAYSLKTLTTLAIVPIFFIIPIYNWSVNNFPISETFYNSRIGTFLEIICYAISIGVYLFIRKMKENKELGNEITPRRFKWEEWVLNKIPFVNWLVIAFTPQSYKKKYFLLERLIKDANESLKVKELTLQRIVVCLSVFLVLVVTFAFGHYREEKVILNSNGAVNMFTTASTEKDIEEFIEKNEFDKQFIKDLKNIKVFPSNEEINIMIAEKLGVDIEDPQVTSAYNRIMYKWSIVSNSFVQWWEILLSIVLAYIASYSPIWLLQYKRKQLLKNMEKEVYQLLVILSMLREFDGMNVTIMLDWMKRFSIAFRKSIIIAIEEFDMGPENALDKLSDTNTFEPFQQIVDRLKLSLVRLSIQEAFSDIEVEKDFYLEMQREEQNRVIDSKSNLGEMVGLLPMGAVFILYLIVPLLYISMKSLNSMVDYLS